MSSNLVNSLAKVYDPNPLHGQKLARKPSPAGSDKLRTSSSPSSSSSSSPPGVAMRSVERRMDSLSSQMEQLLSMQHTVLSRLDGLAHGLGDVSQGLAGVRAAVEIPRGPGGGGGPAGRDSEVVEVCQDLRGLVQETNRRVDNQDSKLEGVEKLVEGLHQALSFVGALVKNSRLVELLFKLPGRGPCSRARKKVSWILATGPQLQVSLRLALG